ncbi:hypothetical protein G6F46_007363 [Rhizopus delemar]|uniref:Uncharacterized protein n=3 Tax=Rhizopus TaxID=4842 RepID=I1CUN1_RHIO9|nr:hypothetical protein RO3G_16872 [Rhizopus delemar RA 99-880]KAG1457328.1 hypothetical protein G6F55_005995 [Rhizopus delemar]KAG1542139.1 hypothetical protein G6F51_007466 [Rhizopus arrhizus]KAG1496155.1 hypothetical protein G6F54_006669 [Rhizopus delemar]KAG1511107.1 hypothetical protein G6F53_006181 [Rhizopus delemar]|eukprot:EIE92161.1 hypothetical protein RO3G_16872 [Rhizopus delemar RA 99-880]
MNNNKSNMKENASKIVDIVEQSTHANTDKERVKLARQASDLHDQTTGHPMRYDEHGNIKVSAEEAQKCPALH